MPPGGGGAEWVVRRRPSRYPHSRLPQSPTGRSCLGKLLPLAGLATAVVVAGTIAFVGSALQGDASTAGVASPGATSSLPASHPTISGGAPVAAPSAEPLSQSIRRLEKARAADPDDTDVLLELGDAYFAQRDYDQAGAAYGDVLELQPEDPTATVRLAMTWHAIGHPRRAIAAILEVLAGRPDDQEAHYSLAIVYFSERRVADARAQWVAAARIDPDSDLGRRSQSFVDLLDGKEPGGQDGEGD